MIGSRDELASNPAASARREVGHVVLCSVYADDNRGSAALTIEAIRSLRSSFPRARVTLVTVRPDDVRRSHRHVLAAFPDVTIVEPPFVVTGPLGGLRATLAALATVLARGRMHSRDPVVAAVLDADVVAARGGYLFMERSSVRTFMSLFVTAFPILLARRLGTPTALLPSAIGPFRRRSSRLLNGWFLRRFDLVCARDVASYAAAAGVGVYVDALIRSADLVLGMPLPDASVADAVTGRLGVVPRRFAAMTITNGPGSAREDRLFRERLAQVARELLGLGVVDQILVVAQVHGEQDSDDAVSAEFVRLIGDDRARYVYDDLSPAELVALYSRASVAICCRLHSAIFALVGRAPTFAVSMYGAKTSGLFRTLGLDGFLLTYPEIDVTEVVRAVTRVVQERGPAVLLVDAAVKRAGDSVQHVPTLISTIA